MEVKGVKASDGTTGREYTIKGPNGQLEPLPGIPDVDFGFLELRHHNGRMGNPILYSLIALYNLFDYQGRLLFRKDVRSIMRMVFEDGALPDGTFEKLDAAQDRVTRILEGMHDDWKGPWRRRIKDWFRLARADRNFDSRAISLVGLRGRLQYESESFDTPFKMGRFRELQEWEACIHYGVVNWFEDSEDSEDKESGEFNTRRALGYHYNMIFNQPIAVSVRLKNRTLEDTRKVAAMAEEHSYFFAPAAARLVKAFQERLLRDAATTTSFSALTIEATAPGSGSYQPPASGPSRPRVPVPVASQSTPPLPFPSLANSIPAAIARQFTIPALSQSQLNVPPSNLGRFTRQTREDSVDFESYIDFDADRSDAYRSDADRSRKGKGKAREASSSSPGEDESRKGKAVVTKSPRRGGK